jgi:hypothetical protein
MAKLLKQDEKFIRDNFENADDILAMEDLNDILDEIFLWMEIHGLDEDEFPNAKGEAAQKVYDSILAYD